MQESLESLPQLSDLPNVLLSYISTGTIVWGIFYITAAFFVIYSLLLLYHWLRYGSLYPLVWVMMIAYFGVSLLLLGTMLGTAVTLT